MTIGCIGRKTAARRFSSTARGIAFLILLFSFSLPLVLVSGDSETGNRSFPGTNILFEQNLGQFPEDVLFATRLPDHWGFLTRDSYAFSRNPAGIWADSPEEPLDERPGVMKLVFNPSEGFPGTGMDESSFKAHYFIGPDRQNWIRNVNHFRRVHFPQVYDGIDIEFYAIDQKIEFDYAISPGADPSQISFTIEGGGALVLDDSGDITAEVDGQKYVLESPEAHQLVRGRRVPVDVSFRLVNDRSAGFSVGYYDSRYPLVIDPALYWATALGGSNVDRINDLKIGNRNSDVYVTGMTKSDDFPAFGTGVSPIPFGWAFVSRLKANSGGEPVFTAYIGGQTHFFSEGHGIALDEDDNIYIAGRTYGYGFPSTDGAFQADIHDEVSLPISSASAYEYVSGDAFVVKLTPTGDEVVYSTLIGGSRGDMATAVAVTSNREAVITGYTYSDDFPLENELDQFRTGTIEMGGEEYPNPDGFITKLNESGTALVYSSYLGGRSRDFLYDIEIDDQDDVYIAGSVEDADFNFPLTPHHWIHTNDYSRYYDAVAMKFNHLGEFQFITILSGFSGAYGYGIDVGEDGHIYLTGATHSSDFPVTPGAFQRENAGDSDAFLSKITPDGTGLVFSTYVGGDSDDGARDVVVNSENQPFLVGYTESHDFPRRVVSNGPQATHAVEYYAENWDGFAAKISTNGRELLYSTYLGGSSRDVLRACEIDRTDDVLFAAGEFTSSDLFDNVSFQLAGYDETPNFGVYRGDGLVTRLGIYTPDSYVSGPGSVSGSGGTTYYQGTFEEYHPDIARLRRLICLTWNCNGQEGPPLLPDSAGASGPDGAFYRLLTLSDDAVGASKYGLETGPDFTPVDSLLSELPARGMFTDEVRSGFRDGMNALASGNYSRDVEESLIRALNAAYLENNLRGIFAPASTDRENHQVSVGDLIDLRFWPGTEYPETVQLRISDWIETLPQGFEPMFPYFLFDFGGEGIDDDLIDIQLDIDLRKIPLFPEPYHPKILEWNGEYFRDITSRHDPSAGILTGRTESLKSYVIVNDLHDAPRVEEPEVERAQRGWSSPYLIIVGLLVGMVAGLFVGVSLRRRNQET